MRIGSSVILLALISVLLCGCTDLQHESLSDVPELSQELEMHLTDDEEQHQEATIFEYDFSNNTVSINGHSYSIVTNEMDFYGGYMFYYLGNSDMEKIMDAINTKELTNKYWREDFSPELLDKVRESTKLEDFVEKEGKILNYYILNAEEFLHSPYQVEMPIVVEYSIDNQIKNTILVFFMSALAEGEEILYRITDIMQVDNLDIYSNL